MNHYRSLFALLLVLVVALTGCTTTPKMKSPDSSLVLIPTMVENTSGASFARKYYLQLSDGYGEFPISDYRGTYVMVMIENPGVKITGIRSVVDTSRNFVGPDGFQKLDIALPYNPGHVVVSETAFQLSMVRIDTQNYSSHVTPLATPPEVAEGFLATLRKNQDNSAWFQD